jgi:hypothetical protein
MRTILLLFTFLSMSGWALAQPLSRPGPAERSAASPRPDYQSAFSDYRPFRDENVRSWKEVNKEVADNHGMGAMKHGPGTAAPGQDAPKNDRKDDYKGKHHDKKH